MYQLIIVYLVIFSILLLQIRANKDVSISRFEKAILQRTAFELFQSKLEIADPEQYKKLVSLVDVSESGIQDIPATLLSNALCWNKKRDDVTYRDYELKVNVNEQPQMYMTTVCNSAIEATINGKKYKCFEHKSLIPFRSANKLTSKHKWRKVVTGCELRQIN